MTYQSEADVRAVYPVYIGRRSWLFLEVPSSRFHKSPPCRPHPAGQDFIFTTKGHESVLRGTINSRWTGLFGGWLHRRTDYAEQREKPPVNSKFLLRICAYISLLLPHRISSTCILFSHISLLFFILPQTLVNSLRQTCPSRGISSTSFRPFTASIR